MKTMTISATNLKHNISEVLDKVRISGTPIIIERYGKPVAKIEPLNKPRMSKAEIEKAIDETFGLIPNFPDVTKHRISRKKKISL